MTINAQEQLTHHRQQLAAALVAIGDVAADLEDLLPVSHTFCDEAQGRLSMTPGWLRSASELVDRAISDCDKAIVAEQRADEFEESLYV